MAESGCKASAPKAEGGCGNSSVGSNPTVSSMVVLQTRSRKGKFYGRLSKRDLRSAQVVIVNGVIVKNRDGGTGRNIKGTIYVWDEREEV